MGFIASQVNLFIAVLKIKFAKAQTLFQSKLAKMSKKKRKNFLGRVMEKGKNRVKDQVKKRREASEVSMSCLPSCHLQTARTFTVLLHLGGQQDLHRVALLNPQLLLNHAYFLSPLARALATKILRHLHGSFSNKQARRPGCYGAVAQVKY